MAKYLTNLDLNQNELQNARIQNLAGHPENPVIGQIYFNSGVKIFYGWNGEKWIDLGAELDGDKVIQLINSSNLKIKDSALSIGINNAVKDSHKHSNRDVLDKTTDSFTKELKTKIDSISAGATKVEQSTSGKIKINGNDVIVYEHPTGANPHKVTKADVGLGNVTNVSQASKSDFDAHIVSYNKHTKDTGHITSAERSTWNGKQDKLGFVPIENGGNVPKMVSGLDSAKPKATGSNVVYISTDTGSIYQDVAVDSWKMIGGKDVPIASRKVVGAIKVGANLTIASDGTLNASDNPSNFIVKQEHFITTQGQTTFKLSKGTYKPNTNSLSCYVNGIKQSSSAISEIDNTTFSINGLDVGSLVLVDYIEISSSNMYDFHSNKHLTGGDDAIPVATTSSDGLMSKADKIALNKKIEKKDLPINVSQLNNDSKYLKEVSWSEIKSVPTEFTPTKHTHNQYIEYGKNNKSDVLSVGATFFNVLDQYNISTKDSVGLKIKTNIPEKSITMNTIIINGFDYINSQVIDLKIPFYTYSSGLTSYSIESTNNFNPKVQLAIESGKVVIVLEPLTQYSTINISVLNHMGGNISMFKDWSIADELVSKDATEVVDLKYNSFVPIKVSELINDSKYIKKGDIVDNAYALKSKDTRNSNDTPKEIMVKSGYGIIADFKLRTSVGNPPVEICASSTYAQVVSIGLWSNYSGGYPVQYSTGGDKLGFRQGVNNDTWGEWQTLPTDTTLKEELKKYALKTDLDALEVKLKKQIDLQATKVYVDAELKKKINTTVANDTFEKITNKGKASGYAPLDTNAKIPLNNLPDLAKQSTHIAQTVADRDKLSNLISGDKCFIVATGDTYIYDGSKWIVVSKAEWENVNLEWNNIKDKPSSTQAQIDTAVKGSHSHSNKSVIDTITKAMVDTWNSIKGIVDKHIADKVAHITSAERVSWNKKTDKYTIAIGDGKTTVFSVSHKLNTVDIISELREVSTGEVVITDMYVVDANTLKLVFAKPPSTNQFKITITG